MNKKEFQNLVIPLSEKEREYQRHPELSKEIYQKRTRNDETNYIVDGVFCFDANPEYFSMSHGEILPNREKPFVNTDLHLLKQTRFSTVPLHRHSYIEMNYVYTGECTAMIDGSKISLAAGDVCIMDAKVVHTISPLREEDIVLNCIMKQSYFNQRFTERLSNSGTVAKFIADTLSEHSQHDQYIVFHTALDERIRELFEDVFCEYLDLGICSEAVIDSYMTMIFIHLARCYQSGKEQEYRNTSRSYMSEVLRYLEENCDICTLTGTAKHFNFHPNYLSRAVKKATGKTFKEIVDFNRLERAVFLLKNTDNAINEIAVQCGWSNLKQFYKKFEAAYHCTPKEYRKRAELD